MYVIKYNNKIKTKNKYSSTTAMKACKNYENLEIKAQVMVENVV